jgi:hypothetical protein
MRIMPVAAVAAVAFVGGGAGALGASAFTGPPASQPVGPVALVAGAFDGTRPSVIQFSGDDGDVVTGIQWSSWGDHSATGRGTVGLNDCTPSCAEGTTRYVAATITLSAPDAKGEWTVITESDNGRTTTFSLTGHWAQGAMS